MRIHIFRAGQLAGNRRSGLWKEDEWIPIMLATSSHLNAIPTFPHRQVDWIPVDIAAETISELVCQQTKDSYSLHHIVNPKPIPWSQVVILVQKTGLSSTGKQMEEVSMQE